MREGIYWITIFIHVAICASLSCFVWADSLPEEDKFEYSQLRQAIEALEDSALTSEKLDLARAYFWIGRLQHALAILDVKDRGFIDSGDLPDSLKEEYFLSEEELDRWYRNCPNDRAKVSLYIGYAYLALGNVSEAYKNFIDAFRFNSKLKYNMKALQYDHLEGVIKEAKIAAQMVTLDLFVFVDISKSVAMRGESIKKLQSGVRKQLKLTDHVLFYPFGDMSSSVPFPDSSPQSASIVKELKTANLTDFAKLFDKLTESLEKHEETVIDPARRTAILIISDGEHSVENDKGGGKARIPDTVKTEFAKFSNYCKKIGKEIPIVIITVDRIGKKGGDYEVQWKQVLENHSVGESFYYNSESELQNTLRQIFDTVAPHRSEMFVIRDPKADNQSFFFNDDFGTVKLLIQCPSQEARLEVTGTPNWPVNDELFSYEWERTIDEQKNIFIFRDSRDSFNNLNITCHNLSQAISDFQPQKPLILTLKFHQLPEQDRSEQSLGEIGLPFEKQRPVLQITKMFDDKFFLFDLIPFGDNFFLFDLIPPDGKFLLRSDESKSLKFQGKIKSSYSLLGSLISLKVKVSENDCFTINGKTRSPTTTIIDIGAQLGWQEFNLPIVAEGVDKFFHKKSGDVTINFQAGDSSTGYDIDNRVEEISFRVVSEWFYWLYQLDLFIWWCFAPLFVISAALYPCLRRIYTVTGPITTHRGEGFKVSGNTIYDSKGTEVLRIPQWWFAKVELVKGILQTAQLRQMPDKQIDLLSKNHRIRPTKSYQIILSKDEEAESTFEVDQNYTRETWWEMSKWVFGFLGFLSIPVVGVGIYVSRSLSVLGYISLVIGFLVVCFFIARISYNSGRSRSSGGLGMPSGFVSSTLGFGRGVGLLDACISLIEKGLQLL